uniref:Uncharacterized protein n=1 Tax=Anopheles darlingi TaxID=43151 RepID=A0A2M4D3S0_ANODA
MKLHVLIADTSACFVLKTWAFLRQTLAHPRVRCHCSITVFANGVVGAAGAAVRLLRIVLGFSMMSWI